MAFADLNGIATRYETVGTGPPLLMFSPGGFNATLDTWTTIGAYAKTRPLEHLSRHYTCIIFDRRETGQSGGRLECVTWTHYVDPGRALLRHLGIERAHLMGGCMGCSPVLAFASAYAEAVAGMILYWPVGGPRYRMSSHQRFNEHLAFVQQSGLQKVVELALETRKPFGADPRGGPWASVIQRDAEFARTYAAQNVDHYKLIVLGTMRSLFDRDTAPGAEPEALMRLTIPSLIVPGHDGSHATSAARYLQECLSQSDYLNIPVDEQSESRVNASLLEFLDLTTKRQG